MRKLLEKKRMILKRKKNRNRSYQLHYFISSQIKKNAIFQKNISKRKFGSKWFWLKKKGMILKSNNWK